MSVTLEPSDLPHREKGGHLCCAKHRAKGRLNPYHPFPENENGKSLGPSVLQEGTREEGCTRSIWFTGEGLVDTDSSTAHPNPSSHGEKKGPSAGDGGQKSTLQAAGVSQLPPGLTLDCIVLTALSKALTYF